MSRYQSRYHSDSDDDMHDGPYYRDGRFYPAGSRSRHSSRETRSSTRQTYSPPPGSRPSRSSYDDEPPCRTRSPLPSPRRTYSPPPGPRPSRSSYDDEPRRRARSLSPPPRASGYSSTHRNYSPPPRPSHSSNHSRPPPAQESSYSAPPPPRPNSPVPYTIDDEEPDTIPHAPAEWNNFTSVSTREQLVCFFVGKGFSKAAAERSIGKEFAAHAPQYRSGQAGPGPSRAEEAALRSRGGGYGSGGSRPNCARSPSPEKFSRYRESARYGSESPEPRYGPYAGWSQQDSGPRGGFTDPTPFRDTPPFRDPRFTDAPRFRTYS